jgi:hypothetical protein
MSHPKIANAMRKCSTWLFVLSMIVGMGFAGFVFYLYWQWVLGLIFSVILSIALFFGSFTFDEDYQEESH